MYLINHLMDSHPEGIKIVIGIRLSTNGIRLVYFYVFEIGAPDTNRTCDPRFRKPLLYPTELRGPFCNKRMKLAGRPTLNFLKYNQ